MSDLRRALIEAAATAYEGYRFYAGSPDFVPEDAMAVALDAMLDLLTERADEWRTMLYDHDWIDGETGPITGLLREFVAVLRNPGAQDG